MYNRGRPIPDKKLEAKKHEYTQDVIGFDQKDVNQVYGETFRDWIENTTLNTVKGLNNFPVQEFSMGTT